MAGYIKGITIEFGADTTKLNAALSKTNGALNKTQAELKQVNRSLKFNPGNTTLLKQKFDLLKQAVTQTEGKLKELRNLQATMKANGVSESSAQWRELEREIIKTENNLKQAEAELRQFGSVGKQQALAVGTAFQNAGNRIKSAGRTITTSFSVYGAAGVYAGARLIDSYEKQALAEQKLIATYKNRMGASKAAAQSTMELASALQKQGVIGDEVALSGAQALATYAKYPSTINTILPAMNNWLAAEKGMSATQEDAEAKAKILGKALNGNVGALNRLGIKLTESQQEILKTGTEEQKAAVITDALNAKFGGMNAELAKTDSGKIQQAKMTLGDMGEEIGAVLLPAVADLATWIGENLLPKIQNLITWFQQHPKIATFALALAGITAVLGPVIMILGSLVSMIGGVISIAAVLGPVIGAVAAPVLAVVAAIAAAVAIGVALYKNWDTIKAKATEVWNGIKQAIFNVVQSIVRSVVVKFQSIKTTVTTIFNAVKSVATTIWNGIKNAITKPIETAKSVVQKAINKIKSFFPLKLGKIFSGLKLPSFHVKGGKAPYGLFGKGTKPSISVTWNKKAMNNPYMFNNATLFGAGEAGDEVLYGRSNLMKDIASAVSGASLNGVVVNVYGSDNMSVNDLADAVEQRLITMQKRRTQAWA